MNVLHICGNLASGGITSFVKSLAELNKPGTERHDIAVVFEDAPSSKTEEIDFIRLPNGIHEPLLSIRKARKAAREYGGIAFHTLHPAAILPFLFARGRYLVFQHGMAASRGGAAKRKLKKFWLSIAPSLLGAKIIYSTPFAVEKTRSMGIRIPPKRRVVMPFGIILRRKTDCPGRIPRTPGEIVVGTAGRLDKVKRFDVLLRSLQEYRGSTRIRLKIAGSGPESSRLAALASACAEDHVRIEFAGGVTDMIVFYDSLDLFVFPSRGESFGLVVLEALARSVPVAVCSDLGGALSLVRDGENGFILKPGIEGLQELWRTLDRNPAILGELARRAAGMDLDEYNIANTRTRLEELLNKRDRRNPRKEH